MSRVTIDGPTGVLVVDGRKVFPIGFSNPPPLGRKAPSGKDGLQELKDAGASFVRTGRGDWSLSSIEAQLAAEQALEDAAAAHGLLCWLWLGKLTDLPPPAAGQPPSEKEQALAKVVGRFEGHPGLGAYKGFDEPQHGKIPVAGLVRGYKKLKELDPDHPVVIIQAPRGTVAELRPYRPAFDVTGADIFPVAYPPGEHAARDNRDISVVGDVTRTMVEAAGGKPVWTTLQIAWVGTATSKGRPDAVPRFPSLPEERFMAYQSIVAGARGLTFFGGHLTQITKPVDAQAGWNWTFWDLVLRPLVVELTSSAVAPALVAPDAPAAIAASASDVQLVARQDERFLYVIAVRRGGATTRVGFSGLPAKHDGAPITGGQVLFEYVQDPLPPPIGAGRQTFRSVGVANGGFRDWFGPHDVHVYRFAL
jgi:hypothetical protein